MVWFELREWGGFGWLVGLLYFLFNIYVLLMLLFVFAGLFVCLGVCLVCLFVLGLGVEGLLFCVICVYLGLGVLFGFRLLTSGWVCVLLGVVVLCVG